MRTSPQIDVSGTTTLSAALEQGEVLVCGPVLAELVAGARAQDREALLETHGGLQWPSSIVAAGRALASGR